MKKIFLILALFIEAAGMFIFCKKDYSYEGRIGNNRFPVASAGSDQVIKEINHNPL